MLILRLCFCLVLISVRGVFGVAVTKGERTESPISTPVLTPTPTSVDGFLKDVQALGLDQADVKVQFITMIKYVTSTVTGRCTPTLVPVVMPPCPTLTVTSTFTLPGTPCTASRDSIPKVQNCSPTDSAYKLLIFDDYFPRGNIDPTIPNVSPQEPDPPADSFIYYGMKFSGNFSFIHCEANSLNPESRLARTCNNNTLVGDYFLSLYSPVSPAPFNGPVKRFITFEGGYFSLVDMLISAFPVPQGALSGVDGEGDVF
ncbi:hypothetical protein L211DRAFT_883304 [Terfezia boudieri ATCC MYA-4762]|uniref:Ubiquitin 3 binding protein But2 C-terminal domain-containing protein n=1 Tax=Terfezia boudieri ATCC MYA-4762 TaxID=1051890 RepID=A0A3N4LJR6_9PEZI|nr:hypothetical protein L211DRAFT_883304 [Terfezia boudieri ATCC MYA-4762]